MEGIIIKGIGGFYYIKTDEGIIECKARGKFRYNSLKPMVGDRVTIKVENGKGVIEDIHERSSELIRPTVANVTQAFVVFAIKNPDINLDLLNRFLTLCEYNDIHAVVCLNKEDLCTEEEKENLKELINDIGYEVLFINAKEGKGFDALKERLEYNITVLCGPSGAGKSTLLNSFIDREHMETGSVSEKIGRGKHTTRHSELIDVDNGYLVDTPGFTTLDVTFIDRDSLKYCFPEFNDYNNLCKFNGCNHYKEPKCAVKEAVEEGKINKLRYEFYIKTLEEIINRRG
ncbi:ribosome small subunit-dependent GTPase A [Clostridium perfringens]|nr:ribosome small subunit-dependent GTPase A [Clostridium perfringens]WEV21223.1 ribosome small subunit-dependent GTPase A [Clostridium perfringens D]